MEIDKFKREFKCLNGVYASDKVVLLKKPLELYNLATGETIATFDSLDEALAFEIDERPWNSASVRGQKLFSL